MINRRIGAFIATLRKEQNLTQEQFAEKLGVSNRSVSRWENGNTLPDFSLMQRICQITGITLAELLCGARQNATSQRQDILLPVLNLFEREKLSKIKSLNWWFSLGLAALLPVILAGNALTPVQTWVLICLGILFHGVGFSVNNQDRPLTEQEKAILMASGETAAMRTPEELLSFARKSQDVSKSQYRTAFRIICDNLTEHEHVSFSMVATEYSVNGAPGIWHAGIAVTQERILLCGETMIGSMLFPRSILTVYDQSCIASIRCTSRGIVLKTTHETVTFKGENMEQSGRKFEQAVLSP